MIAHLSDLEGIKAMAPLHPDETFVKPVQVATVAEWVVTQARRQRRVPDKSPA